MSFWDSVAGVANVPGAVWDHTGHKLLSSEAQDEQAAAAKKGKKYQFLGDNPYKAGWDNLISQLNQRAAGQNSLAEMQARDTLSAAQSNLRAQSAGRSAGAAREAALGGAQLYQSVGNAAAQARLAEQNQAQSALNNALANAGSAQFSRDSANQAAAIGLQQAAAAQGSDIQKAAGIAGQLGAAYGAVGGGAAKPAAPAGGPGAVSRLAATNPLGSLGQAPMMNQSTDATLQGPVMTPTPLVGGNDGLSQQLAQQQYYNQTYGPRYS